MKQKLTLEGKHRTTFKNEKKSTPIKLELEPKNLAEWKNEPKS